MSRLTIRFTAGFGLLFAALSANAAVSAYYPAESRPACDVDRLARAGALTSLGGQDAWISTRGEVFRLSKCPALKDRLVARGS